DGDLAAEVGDGLDGGEAVVAAVGGIGLGVQDVLEQGGLLGFGGAGGVMKGSYAAANRPGHDPAGELQQHATEHHGGISLPGFLEGKRPKGRQGATFVPRWRFGLPDVVSFTPERLPRARPATDPVPSARPARSPSPGRRGTDRRTRRRVAN